MTAVMREAKRPGRKRSHSPASPETVTAAVTAVTEAKDADDKERRIENTIDFAIAHFEAFGVIGAEYMPG